jgi:TRAP-type C4-dicarboxylate transport system permease small subunit
VTLTRVRLQKKERKTMMTMLRAVDSVLVKVMKIFSAASSFLMMLLTIVVFGEVISRYFFGFPITFSSELTTIFFPWMVFLMAVEVTRNRDHMAITVFRGMMPARVQSFLRFFAVFVMLFFSGYMVVSSYELSATSSSITLPVLRFMTKAYLYSSLLVSFTLIFLVLVIQLVELASGTVPQEKEEPLL